MVWWNEYETLTGRLELVNQSLLRTFWMYKTTE